MPELAFAVPPTLTYLPPPVAELPARLVDGAVVLPGRDALVEILPKGTTLVEVGVATGLFTSYALAVCAPRRMVAIDTFRLHELPEFWGRKPAEYFGDLSHADWFRARFAGEVASGQLRVMEGDSAAMLEQLDDASVDVFYLDADHTYECVRRELEVIVRKVKPDGYIVLDDYILVEHLHASHLIGVIYAAHEFMIAHDWALHYFTLQTNTYYQVVLRRADQPPPAQALARECAALRAEVAALRGSTSWRVTAPLRTLGGLLSAQTRRAK